MVFSLKMLNLPGAHSTFKPRIRAPRLQAIVLTLAFSLFERRTSPRRRPLRSRGVPQRHSVSLTENRTSADPTVLAPPSRFRAALAVDVGIGQQKDPRSRVLTQSARRRYYTANGFNLRVRQASIWLRRERSSLSGCEQLLRLQPSVARQSSEPPPEAKAEHGGALARCAGRSRSQYILNARRA